MKINRDIRASRRKGGPIYLLPYNRHQIGYGEPGETISKQGKPRVIGYRGDRAYRHKVAN